jgi:hypothetical protein
VSISLDNLPMLRIVAARTFNLILLDAAAMEKHGTYSGATVERRTLRTKCIFHFCMESIWRNGKNILCAVYIARLARHSFSVLCTSGHIVKYQIKEFAFGRRASNPSIYYPWCQLNNCIWTHIQNPSWNEISFCFYTPNFTYTNFFSFLKPYIFVYVFYSHQEYIRRRRDLKSNILEIFLDHARYIGETVCFFKPHRLFTIKCVHLNHV